MRISRRAIRVWFVMLSVLLVSGGIIPPGAVSASTDTPNVIHASLGNDPVFDGLTVLPGDISTTPQVAVKGGEQSWGTNKSGGVQFMYLNAAPGFFVEGQSRVEVSVDYYDGGTGKFNLMYLKQGAWQEEKYVHLTGSNTWKTHRFYVSDGALITKMRLGLYGPKMGSSQEDVFFKSVTVSKLPDYSMASSVRAVLKSNWTYEGIKVRMGGNDKYVEPIASYGSREGWSTQISNDYAYMNFDLDSSYGSGKNQKVEIDYFDRGAGKFNLRYSTANGNVESEMVQMTGTNEWKTHVFQPVDADYSAIRLAASVEDIVIGAIKVSKANDPEPDHEVVAATLGANPVFSGLHMFPGDPFLRDQIGKAEVIGGKESWRTDKSNSRNYLYMEVTDEEFVSRGDNRVEVTVEYYDGPVGKFALSYRNSTGWRDMKHIRLTGTNSWKRERFIVLQADLTQMMRLGIWSSEMGSTSEEDVYFSEVSIRHLGNYSDAQTVKAKLNSDWKYEGINVFPGDNAKNKAPIVARSEQEGWATDTANGAKYLYFNVDDTYVYDVDMPIEVEVTYLDVGKGTIVTEYDAIKGGFTKANPIQLTDSGTWKTNIVALPHAKFSNRANGTDYRLYYAKAATDTAQDVVISAVTVNKYVPETRDMKIIPTTIGSVFLVGEPISLGLKTVAKRVDWKLENYWGAPFGEGSAAVGEDGTLTLSMPALGKGYYKLHVTAADGERIVKRTTTPITVLSSNEDTIGQSSPFSLATHFGQSLDQALVPLISRLGVSMVRDELYWGAIEKEKGVYQFPEMYDSYMAALKQHRISPLIVLSYNNNLYPGGFHIKDPAGVAGFANYARAVLNHYGDQIKEVEVWNEYNAFGGGAAPSYYYPLLKETYAAVKSLREDVRVIGPAGVTIPYDWIEELFALGGLNYLDGVSVHPYRFPEIPEGGDLALDKLNKLIAKYNTSGKEIPLWLTEMGWHTKLGGDGVSEDKQAEYLARYNVLAISEGVENITWYDFKNDGAEPENREHNFGIIVNEEDGRGAYTAKPAFATYAVQTRQLTGAEYIGQEQVYGNVRSYLFRKNGEDLRVLWSLTPQKVVLPTESPVIVTDFTGEEQTLVPLNGKVYLKLGNQVLYVKGNVTGIQAGGMFSADDVVAAVNDHVRVNVRLDNTGSAAAMEAEVEVAGVTQTVSVPANGQLNVPISLPAVRETGSRTYIANVKVNGQLRAHLLVTAKIEEPFGMEVAPHIASLDDQSGQLKISYTNNSVVSAYTLTSLEWQLGELSGSQAYDEAIPPASVWRGSVEVPIPAYSKPYAYQVKLNFKETAPVSLEGYTEFNPIVKKTVSGERLQEVQVPRYALNLIETGNNRVRSWKGPDDLSGDFWLNWDEEHFYLTAKIKDDIHYQDQCGSSSWTGDGIQFAIFSGVAGKEIPDKYEYGFALCPNGQTVVHRWSTPQGVEVGDVTNVEAKVIRDEETKYTYYYIALPWSELAPVHPDKGMMSFSLLFNENDGAGRRDFFEWGGGIGSSKDYKELRPMQFMGATVPEEKADKAALMSAVAEARKLHDAAVVGDKAGQFPAAAKDEFLAAIEVAEAVVADEGASQAGVDAGVTQLSAAIAVFKAAEIKEDSGEPGDATLKSLHLNGEPIAGFAPDKLQYTVVLDKGAKLPEITAEATDTKATVRIEPAEQVPGTAMVAVTSESGAVTREYRISFELRPVEPAKPQAHNGSYVTAAGKAISGQLTAEHAEGTKLTYEIVAGGKLGTVKLGDAATGNFVFTPHDGSTGEDRFTFRVHDGHQYSNTATVTITIEAPPVVNPPIDPPVYPGGTDLYQTYSGQLYLPAGVAGEVSLGQQIKLTIPAGATDTSGQLKIAELEGQKLQDLQAENLLSPVFELSQEPAGAFKKKATLRIAFDAGKAGKEQIPTLMRYDAKQKTWMKVEGKVDGDSFIAEVDQLGVYAVMAVKDEAVPPQPTKEPKELNDIAGHWGQSWIEKAVQAGVVKGFADHTYRPDQAVTRQELIAILARALKPQAGAEQAPGFRDEAKIGKWASAAVAAAVQAGWITGYSDGSFRPQEGITRVELAAVLARAAGGMAAAGSGEPLSEFRDAKQIPLWAQSYVAQAAASGLMEGTGAGMFKPAGIVTRAEAAAIAVRLMEQSAK
ncbi:S-layer homology domain-containing protein [Paenibacillus sp. GCM10027626]|uniref:S-layer homology domain-containing protein n=1 Tax=Paenibacillus sp. GCM10027626 TaxID=3273411 RepID=UPI0036337460